MSLLKSNTQMQRSEDACPGNVDSGFRGARLASRRLLASAIPVLLADLDGKIVGCSTDALDVFGVTAQETLGRNLPAFALAEVGPLGFSLQEAILAGVFKAGYHCCRVKCQTIWGKSVDAELSVTCCATADR